MTSRPSRDSGGPKIETVASFLLDSTLRTTPIASPRSRSARPFEPLRSLRLDLAPLDSSNHSDLLDSILLRSPLDLGDDSGSSVSPRLGVQGSRSREGAPGSAPRGGMPADARVHRPHVSVPPALWWQGRARYQVDAAAGRAIAKPVGAPTRSAEDADRSIFLAELLRNN